MSKHLRLRKMLSSGSPTRADSQSSKHIQVEPYGLRMNQAPPRENLPVRSDSLLVSSSLA